jgi:hypothetical protein
MQLFRLVGSFYSTSEVVSKPSIGFKVKANCDGQPKEYREYFEDWTSQFNTQIETEGRI